MENECKNEVLTPLLHLQEGCGTEIFRYDHDCIHKKNDA